MDDSSKLPDISNLLVNDSIIRADKQAEILQRFSLIADRIRPRFSLDGSNFNTWSRNLIDTWSMCFIEDMGYFENQERDTDYRRNLIALSFIRNSVERSLYDSIIARMTMPNARTVYQAIKKRFSKASWSSIVHHANFIFNSSDHQHDTAQHVIRLNEAIESIESQLGPLDSSKILTLSLFFSLPNLQAPITSALDTRLAANPGLQINAEDIMDIVQQMRSRSAPISNDNSIQLSKIDASHHQTQSSLRMHTPVRNPRTYRNTQPPSQNSPIASRSEEWKKKWLTPRNPCFHCGEAGHWAPDCPARKKSANARFSSSQRRVDVASIGAIPALEYGEALLDSGATHSVVGDVSLFTTMQKTNITLLVASSHKFMVETIREITLTTRQGILTLQNVLFCPAITGVILSISQMVSQGISIKLINNDFHVRQRNISFHIIKKNLRWNLKRLMQFKAAEGIPNFHIDNIKICHSCSISKAEHRPFMSPSRRHVNQPGDMIAADLIGPLPVSIDGKKYALVIQDIYSRLTAIIALTDKSKAKSQLRLWMIKFENMTKFNIRAIRTDNGAEFCNHLFNNFLKEKGITHELSIPYEHHQNGQIEQTNRTISEMARTSLIAANLPSSLWTYAFRHAVWIFNRTLHSDNRRTPYEIVGSRKPSMIQLRVFGAKAFILNHQSRKDLGQKGFVGYHLGITQDSKGWLFWLPERGTVIRSASVKFDEETFFQQKHSILLSIQTNDIFDNSMIKQINLQDSLISKLNSSDNLSSALPTSYKEAMSSTQAALWQQAINDKLNSMTEQEVFMESNLQDALKEVPRESILSTKWVFAKKGKPERFKGRLVARGFRQIHGINFEETFAPTPTFGALRMLFLIACRKKWTIRTFDVKVAFLHSLIDKPVYVWPPNGMNVPKHHVLKLKKALYGTKQAARCWWLHLKTILDRIGFKSNGEDPSTYFFESPEGQAMLWIHVDDGALAGSSEKIINLISMELDKHLQIKWDAEITGLVGLSIKQSDSGYEFNQNELITKLTNLTPSKITANSPLPQSCSLVSNTSKGMDREYLKRIGMLLYIAQGTRPDISYAVNYLARFSMGTDSSHWEAIEHLIGYLRKTSDITLKILAHEEPDNLRCYVDANLGGEGNRSTHGFLILHGGNPIIWQSKRQATVASSTAQAEYIALSFAAKECIWLYNMCQDLLSTRCPQLLSDNKTAIGIATNSVSRKQTRHLIREFNLLNELIVSKKIQLNWVNTQDQLADILTKSLGQLNVKKFLTKTMMA
ncbi:hypothetical protein O181_074368 [Austropuccinia psidii MF-1]|uniref:Gag-Pol-p199 n=1 Tax=Austropuccinia psidii MF-1 TaxID=1389203 RepID=A0A9Q3IAW8_9BASI|nr:hypothetical protein [Austropuccinia psidii MF-1]